MKREDARRKWITRSFSYALCRECIQNRHTQRTVGETCNNKHCISLAKTENTLGTMVGKQISVRCIIWCNKQDMQVHNATSTCLVAKGKVYSTHMKASKTVSRGRIHTYWYVKP